MPSSRESRDRDDEGEGAKHRDSDSDDDAGSEQSSYNSGDYGTVARSGFTRMYVLSHTALDPTDTSEDYHSAFVVDDERWRDSEQQSGEAKVVSGNSSLWPSPCYQLLYASGGHYFHGEINLPATLGLEQAESKRARGDAKAGGDDDDDIGDNTAAAADGGRQRQRDLSHRIDIADLPVLLPHFQEHQDALLAVDSVTHFRSEVRDVVYQMEEVGAFLVEELAKDKNVARIEHASQELLWIDSSSSEASAGATSANTTFFELQTHAGANDSLDDAGVVLVVMKIVVRDVLLDVVYCRNSYYVALRDASCAELELEDVFIPKVACVGPCFVVRSYNDDDIKKLVLWGVMPVSDIDAGLAVKGAAVTADAVRGSASVTLPLQAPLACEAGTSAAKVAPMQTAVRAILDANDSQMYCLLSPRIASGGRTSKSSKANIACKMPQRRSRRRPQQRATSSGGGSDSVGDDAESDQEQKDVDMERDHERRERVVFQFNQYVYYGELQLDAWLLDDLAKLSTRVFPYLRAQSHSLAYFGKVEDLPTVSSATSGAPRPRDANRGDDSSDNTVDSASTLGVAQFAAVRQRFDELAPTLLTLLTDSQAWIQDFFAEVDAIAIAATEDSTLAFSSPTSTSAPVTSPEWLATHLKAWLEADDGTETFFELELRSSCPLAQSSGGPITHSDDAEDSDGGCDVSHSVDLVIWRGIVHAALMVVVYRRGSFYMLLRDASSSESLATLDARELVGAIPALGNKGRGYLVRAFPDTMPRASQQWLAGAKLLLWQTSASLALEEAREARTRAERRASSWREAGEHALCADWLIEGEVAMGVAEPLPVLAAADRAEAKAQRADSKSVSEASSAKSGSVSAKATSSCAADKAGRRHHIPPLAAAHATKFTTTAPWDLRTGRPL